MVSVSLRQVSDVSFNYNGSLNDTTLLERVAAAACGESAANGCAASAAARRSSRLHLAEEFIITAVLANKEKAAQCMVNA